MIGSLEISCSQSHLSRLPYHELPRQMVVAIDGTALSGKFTTGERIAESIGGLIVDSASFYRALANAATAASIDLENADQIKGFCESVCLDVHWDLDGCLVEEAIVSINGQSFHRRDFLFSRINGALISRVPEVRALVTDAIRRCRRHGRLVVLGRNIGSTIFPTTPFKFFLTAPRRVREERHFFHFRTWGAARLDRLEGFQLKLADDALILDTGVMLPDAVRSIVLTEIFLRSGNGIAH